MKKKIKKTLNYIFFDYREFPLENRLLISAIITGIFISLLGSVVSIIISSSTVVIITSLSLLLMLILFYYLVRIKQKFNVVVFPIVIVSIIGISIIWIFDGGINGANLFPGIVILILSLIIVPDKNKKYVISFFIVSVIIIYLIQLYRPDLIVDFSSEKVRWTDSIITVIYSSFLIFIIIKLLHKSYTLERQRAEVRLKELNCLYGISKIIEKSDLSLEEIFHRVVSLIPTSWQYPEIAVCQIIIDDIEYKELNFKKANWMQSSEINVNGKNVGTINICYLEEMPRCDEGPFLKEERLLIDAVAKHLGRVIERKQAEDILRNSKERIKMLNKIIRHDLSNDFAVINYAVKIFKRNSDVILLDEIEKRVQKSLNAIAGYRKSESYLDSNAGLDALELSDVINSVAVEYPKIKFKIEGKGRVFGDDTLYSVFDNLVSNSTKHGKASQIDINISEDNDMCRIEFADNGTGIPDKIKDKIFDEGFIHGKTGNTGIGLFIVKQTIEDYGGSISVEDNQPTGAIFIIKLKKVNEK
jgi:two-component sensor histidine kinase